jgi:protein-S-isoprenylcysteine O-methyltransferase Ste14
MNLEKSTKHHSGRHAGREDLTGEHKAGDTGQLIFLALYLAIWIPDSFFFHWTTFLTDRLAWYYHTIPGLLILTASGYLAFRGLRIVFGEVRKTPHVITTGVFSVVRHPIYLSCILFYIGQFFMTLSLASLALWVFIVIFYWYISRHEEKLLIEKYTDEYRDYMKKVPMLFPVRLKK